MTTHGLFDLGKRCSQTMKQVIRTLQMSPYRWLFDVPASIVFGGNLKALATVYGSDKWNTHWYAQHYEAHFRSFRRKRLTLVEIGIGGYSDQMLGGGSLRMWRTFFPNAHIHGIDICDKSPHAERRITIHKGSQVDMEFLKGVIDKAGQPDIIIDDGSHQSAHVIATFQFLFPLLANDGYYVVEDTQTSYWPGWYGGSLTERDDPRTTMGFFKSLVDGINWEEYYGDCEANAYDLQIKSISFYHNLVVIRKGNNREGSVNREWHANREDWQAATREREQRKATVELS
jgi:hypothetical protein